MNAWVPGVVCRNRRFANLLYALSLLVSVNIVTAVLIELAVDGVASWLTHAAWGSQLPIQYLRDIYGITFATGLFALPAVLVASFVIREGLVTRMVIIVHILSFVLVAGLAATSIRDSWKGPGLILGATLVSTLAGVLVPKLWPWRRHHR